jgi:hypothetical protein
MRRQEARKRFDEFMAARGERVFELTKLVRSTPGYASWTPGLDKDCWINLGRWVKDNLKTEPRVFAESASPSMPKFVHDDLTKNHREFTSDVLDDLSTSIAVDIGICMGEMVHAYEPKTIWRLDTCKTSWHENTPILVSTVLKSKHPEAILVPFENPRGMAEYVLRGTFPPEIFYENMNRCQRSARRHSGSTDIPPLYVAP